MTHPNPFAQNVPATEQQAPPAAPAPNPYAPQPQPPQQVPQAYAPQQAPTVNPYAQQAPTPPQAYAPAAPPPPPYSPYGQQPQQAPQYAPPAPQPAPQQQYTAPAALGQATAPPPPPPSGGKGANVADMYGRLVIIFPHVVQNVAKRADFVTDEQRARGEVTQDRMTATVVVLDGGDVSNMAPIAFGGNPHVLGGRPHDQSAPLPYVRKGMWINQSKVIAQVSDYMPGRAMAGPNGSPGAAVGRLAKEGPEQNAAWYLTTPSEAELHLANAYLGLVAQGQYPHPLAP